MVSYKDLTDIERLAIGLWEIKIVEWDWAREVAIRTALKVIDDITPYELSQLQLRQNKEQNEEMKIMILKIQCTIIDFKNFLLFQKHSCTDTTTKDSQSDTKNECDKLWT